MYKPVKELATKTSASTTSILNKEYRPLDNVEAIKERWKTMLKNPLQTCKPTVLSGFPKMDLRSRPLSSEAKDAICGLKNKKAPGPDALPTKLLKVGYRMLEKILHKVTVAVWTASNFSIA